MPLCLMVFNMSHILPEKNRQIMLIFQMVYTYIEYLYGAFHSGLSIY
jgi:hypothetical protein